MAHGHPASRSGPYPAGVTVTVLRRARLVDLGGRRAADADALVDVRVADGRVLGVVPTGGATPPADATGPVEVVDLDGRWLVPGLWDAHTHMTQWALARRRLDVSAASSAAHAASLVGARLRHDEPPSGMTLVGAGFRDALWPDEPTAAVLDAVTGPVPVVLVSGDLHCGWFNTAAAERYGVAGSGPDGGTPGLVREHAWFAVLDRIEEAPQDVADAWVAEAAAAAATRGVVGVVDFERSSATAAWQRRLAAGQRGLRVVASVWPENLDAAVADGLRSGDVLPGTDELVTVGPLKVIADGSLNTRTAWCHEPYRGLTGPHARGVLNVPSDVLVPLLARASAAGLHGAIHAIGDAATSLVLDAFEATGARGSVEHAQLVSAPDVQRFAALGLTASVQPEHAMDDRDVADRHWAGRTDRAFPLRELHQAGVRLAFGSDAPVAPLDPWAAVAAAVERTRDDRPAWHPEQRLPVDVALAASTRGRTMVAEGDPADLAVLDADPLTTRGAALRSMPVSGTMLAGRWTHRTV